jgi:transposase InsO family protein
MPWKETCAVEQRLAFVHEILRAEDSKAELCRRYGISRPTGDKWLERFELQGEAGLSDLSSIPHHHANQVADELAQAIMGLRTEHMTWGPRKLLAYLKRGRPQERWPVASTIGDLLRRRGLSTGRKRRHHAAPRTVPFQSCDGPNAVWCIDFKGWFATGDGRRCYPLTLTDAFSRYLLRCQSLERAAHGLTQPILEAAFREYGLPRAIRSDNGCPFASMGLGGLSCLSIWWLKLGIMPERIEPGKPQQNGRHERMHRTLKQETTRPAERTLQRQQVRFDEFRQEYNQQRPHEALGQRPPAELYEPSPRRYPSRVAEVEYPDAMEVRRVRRHGEIKWQGRVQFVSEVLAHEPVGLEPLGQGYWLLYFSRLPLAVVDDRRKRLWTLDSAARKGWIAPTPKTTGLGDGAET